MPNSAEDVKLERRRLRMRLAQRKHRARQEQKVSDLEEEKQSLQTSIDALESSFGNLEIKLLEATLRDPQVSADVRRAIDFFRQSVHLKPSPYRGQGVPPSLNVPIDPYSSIIGDNSLSQFGEPLSPFALQLYEYCTRLATRILSSKDGPSLRLARKIFQHRLRVDAANGEDHNLAFLRECLNRRSKKLDDKNRASLHCHRVLDLPRWPGFDQFLDVLGVEKHLRDKGIKFKEDSVQLDANESLMSNDVLNFDTGFQESTGQQEVLPFGLVDEGDGKMFGVTSNSFGGIPTPESQGSPVMTDDWMQFDATLVQDMDALPEYDDTPFSQTFVQISFADLIERLALSAICIGGPGPGFLPSDVDDILTKLTAQAWEGGS